MKILAIADRNPKIDIIETVKVEKIDLIITLGDLTSADIYARRPKPTEYHGFHPWGSI